MLENKFLTEKSKRRSISNDRKDRYKSLDQTFDYDTKEEHR